MSKKRLSVSLLVGIVAWVLLGGAPRATAAEEPNRYTNKDKGFSITFPADWERKEGQMGTIVLALSPQEGPADQFRENVNVTIEDLPKTLSSDEYVEACLGTLRKVLTDLQEHENSAMNVADAPAKRLIFSHRMDAVKVKAMQCVLVKGTRGYVITCSAAPDQFDTYRPKFDEIVQSFRFEP